MDQINEQNCLKKWFLTKKKEFIECEVLEENPKKRTIKIIENGHILQNKTIKIWGEKIAGGKLYPRLFLSKEKPIDFFDFNGRILLKNKDSSPLIPIKDNEYLFQPITSQIIDGILESDKILLTGESGLGKTSNIEQIASRTNNPVIRINMNAETRLGDFLGRIHVENGKTFWKDGVLPTAMRNGYFLIIDELDMADSGILSLLHPVLEDNGKLILKENEGEVITPHPNFRIFATANSIGSMQSKSDVYTGTNIMNEAFLDRWHILEMPALTEKIETKIIKSKVPALKAKHAKNIVQFANLIRKGGEKVEINLKFSTRRALQWGKKMALYRDPVKAAEAVFLFKISSEEKEWVIRTIKTVFSTKRKDKDEDRIKSKKEVKDK